MLCWRALVEMEISDWNGKRRKPTLLNTKGKSFSTKFQKFWISFEKCRKRPKEVSKSNGKFKKIGNMEILNGTEHLEKVAGISMWKSSWKKTPKVDSKKRIKTPSKSPIFAKLSRYFGKFRRSPCCLHFYFILKVKNIHNKILFFFYFFFNKVAIQIICDVVVFTRCFIRRVKFTTLCVQSMYSSSWSWLPCSMQFY